MRLSTKSEYACLALMDLARRHGGGRVKAGDIARRRGLSEKYLERILQRLREAGYVDGRRGAKGGYRLARAPQRITVAEIVRLLDGPLASVRSASKYFYRHTPMEQDPALMRLMREVRRLVVQRMEATTFGGLVRREEAGK